MLTDVQALVVVSEVPFAWEDRDKMKRMERTLNKRENHYLYDQWVYRPFVLEKMLDSFFAWRDEWKGARYCSVGELRDEATVFAQITEQRRLVDMQQIAVGPVTAQPAVRPAERGLRQRHFEFNHELCKQHNYGLLEVDVHAEEDLFNSEDEETVKKRQQRRRARGEEKAAADAEGEEDNEEPNDNDDDSYIRGRWPRIFAYYKARSRDVAAITPFDADVLHAGAPGREPDWFKSGHRGNLLVGRQRNQAEEEPAMRQLKLWYFTVWW